MCSLFLTGCACVLSQIPPQTIYAGSGCSATLPDYRSQVIATDNCEISEFTQTPIPGTLLYPGNMVIDVTLKAIDNSGNFSQIVFSVALVDTIKPILIIAPELMATTEEDIVNLYDTWEKAVKINGLANFIYDQTWTQGYSFADTTFIMDQLHYFTNIIELTDEEYDQYVILKESE